MSEINPIWDAHGFPMCLLFYLYCMSPHLCTFSCSYDKWYLRVSGLIIVWVSILDWLSYRILLALTLHTEHNIYHVTLEACGFLSGFSLGSCTVFINHSVLFWWRRDIIFFCSTLYSSAQLCNVLHTYWWILTYPHWWYPTLNNKKQPSESFSSYMW